MDGDRRLRVRVCDVDGKPVGGGGLAAWLERIAPARAYGQVTVAIVSDARVRALNRRYRRIDRATDVLSFPANPAPGTRHSEPRTQNPAPEPHPAAGTRNPEPVLGDIVIASGVSRRQARDARHDHATELRVLALHGLLHLLGYDHARDDGRMGRVEARLRRKGGLTTSLMERSAEMRMAQPSANPSSHASANHDPERKRRQRAGVGPRAGKR
jgi:probable rRNA maturation factor